jgi:hypothetical protein
LLRNLEVIERPPKPDPIIITFFIKIPGNKKGSLVTASL